MRLLNNKFWKRLPLDYIVDDDECWELTEDIEGTLSNGVSFKIPKGFRTDGSSSPRWLWSLFPPIGKFFLAAIVHDYLYFTGLTPKVDADLEMLRISNKLNDNKLDNFLRFIAVLLFGRKSYK